MPDLTVRAHDSALFICQRSRLLQDPIRDRHLPDIVQESAPRDLWQALGREVHRLGDGQRECRDAFAVSDCFRILQVERAAERFQGGVVGLLELYECSPSSTVRRSTRSSRLR